MPRYHKKFRLALIISGLALISGFLNHQTASAQSVSAAQLANLGVCGNTSSSHSIFLNSPLESGDIYTGLGNRQEAPTSITVYFQSFTDGQCHEIGQATATYGQWTLTGSYSFEGKGAIVVNGSGLSALPYQPVAKLLIAPSSGLCIPNPSCNSTYKGYSGVLEPQQITGATEPIGIYQLSPIAGVGESKVSYYADGQYVYGGTALLPFNRNYLSGGTHNVSIQVSFKNSEILNINQTVNMGLDITGAFFIKSLIYRTHNKVIVFALLGAVLLCVLLVIWIIRLLYKHHLYKLEHGLIKQSEPPKPPDETLPPAPAV